MPSKKRDSIGTNPLDSLLGDSTKKQRQEAVPKAPLKEKSIRATFHIPEHLIGEARNAVVALSGPPVRLTLAAFAEEAFKRELERLRSEYNKGKHFPYYGPVRGGRPIGR